MRFNRFVSAAVTAAVAVCASGADGVSVSNEEKIDYMPRVHGVIRARYEGELPDWEQRFQVANARLSVAGNVLRNLDYFVQFDACNKGKMQFLDAWARLSFAGEWRVQAGQFRVPFGVDAFRAPGTYVFANRSFIGKYMANVRQVGAKIGWYGTPAVPLTVEAGVFNSSPMTDHQVWQKGMDFAAKAVWRLSNVSLSASFLTMKPTGARQNLVDGAVTWQSGRWIAEGEYQHLHYVDASFKDVNAWNIWASYSLPLKKTVFDALSFMGRFDGMTDHSSGAYDADGQLTVNDYGRNRMTLGASLSYTRKPVKFELQLNYENYFFTGSRPEPQGSRDKLVAELIVKF